MTAITRRQREVLDFIIGFIDERKYSPSYAEIADGMKLNSLATVHKHIETLQRKGFLKRNFNHSRSIELRGKSPNRSGAKLVQRAVLHLLHTGRYEDARILSEL